MKYGKIFSLALGAVLAGSAFLPAQCGVLRASALTIIAQIDELKAEKTEISVGEEVALKVVWDEVTETGVKDNLIFSSDSPKIAKVDQKTGVVTGLSAGKAVIKAVNGISEKTVEITVKEGNLKNLTNSYSSLEKIAPVTVSGNQALFVFQVMVNQAGCVVMPSDVDWSLSGTADFEYESGVVQDNFNAVAYCLVTAENSGTVRIKGTEQTVYGKGADFFLNLNADENGIFSDKYDMKEPVCGDTNGDGKLSVSDAVLLEKYLLNVPDVKIPDISLADLDYDGKVNIFDLCLLKSSLLKNGEVDEITAEIVPINGGGGFWNKAHENPEGVITSVDELKDYLFEIYVDNENESYMENWEYLDYLEKYDEEFFEENILCLRAIAVPNGGISYDIKNVRYEGESLVINCTEYIETTCAVEDVVSAFMAEVAVPRSVYDGGKIEWNIAEDYGIPEVQIDMTESYSTDAEIYALEGHSPEKITSPEELDIWLDGKFGSAVERSLRKKYDKNFFEENFLITSLYITPYYETTAVTTDRTGNSFSFDFVVCDSEKHGAYPPNPVVIAQAVLPKYYENYVTDLFASYPEGKTISEKSVNYSCIDIDGICMGSGIYSTTKNYTAEGRWIQGREELKEYLRENLTEEGFEIINSNIDYSDGRPAYVWLDSNVIGTEYNLISAYDSAPRATDKKITLNLSVDSPISCDGGSFLHILRTDVGFRGSDVEIRSFFTCFFTSEDAVHFGGNSFNDFYIYDGRYSGIIIDEYTFGDETSADVYLAIAGGGDVQYADYELVGSFELEKDFFPFAGEYDKIVDDDRTVRSYTGENFEIIQNGENIAVKCRTSPDSEFETLEISLSR